ncbi:MAG TPA: hypothetical protein VJA40_03725, partial [archaeon]|nr:hypothetical protein [archaeon]
MPGSLALVLAIALSVTHYFNAALRQRFKRYESDAASFAGGISIAYLFLQIMPELYAGYTVVSSYLFVFVLVGFTLMHLIEKQIQSHTHRLEKRREELKELHSAYFFFYHFLVGVVLLRLVELNAVTGALFFVPVFLYTLASGVSLSEVHERVRGHAAARLLLSSSSLFGVFAAAVYKVPDVLFYALFSFVGGMFFYVVIREAVPSERKGHPNFFLA